MDSDRREAKEASKRARHVMHAEMKAAVANDIRRNAREQALALQESLDAVRGQPLRLVDAVDLTQLSAVMVSRGAQILEDLASHAPDLDVRAKSANWLMLGGIELQRLAAEIRGEAQPQNVVQLQAAQMPQLEQFGEQLTEVLQLRRKLAARGG